MSSRLVSAGLSGPPRDLGPRIGDRAPDLPADDVRRVHDGDVAVLRPGALAHLLRRVVQAHDARAAVTDDRLGHDERLAEGVVEALGDVARELDVLLLVLAHRDGVGLVQQDVRRHEHRVVEEADRDALALGAGRLVLELRHPAQLAHVRDRVEDPHELAVRGHVALHEDDRALGIDAAGEEQIDEVDRVAPQLCAHLPHGDRVQVDGAIHAIVGLLHGDPVLDGAEVVAQMQRAGRLDAAEDAGASCWFLFLRAHGPGVYRSGRARATARTAPARRPRTGPRDPVGRCDPPKPGATVPENRGCPVDGRVRARRSKEWAGAEGARMAPDAPPKLSGQRNATGRAPEVRGRRPRRTG